jgi:hypothetical protein
MYASRNRVKGNFGARFEAKDESRLIATAPDRKDVTLRDAAIDLRIDDSAHLGLNPTFVSWVAK